MTKQVEARLISSKGDKAQVVCLLGEGSQRRSVTCHVRRQNGRWQGRNPDEAAIAQLDAAEDNLVEVQRAHRLIEHLPETTAKDIGKMITKIRKQGKKERGIPRLFREIIEGMMLMKLEVTPESVKKIAKTTIAESAASLSAVTKETRSLQRATPREVEFIF